MAFGDAYTFEDLERDARHYHSVTLSQAKIADLLREHETATELAHQQAYEDGMAAAECECDCHDEDEEVSA